MNTAHPHDLRTEEEVRALPAAARRLFAPIPARDVPRVQGMTPEERARYLAEHPLDALRVERARERRERRAAQRQQAT